MPSWYDELANAITHGAGFLLALAGATVLIVLASLRSDAWAIVACSIYGATLVLLYAASTLYHSLPGPRVKRVFRVIDHSSIFLLIAGTYTPFMLVNLRGGWGWTLFGIVWGLAALGIVFKAFLVERFEILSTLVYLAMGWLVLIAVRPLLQHVPADGVIWLVAGGVAYSAGVIFFCATRLRFHHAIWHLFVLAGSACHYLAVMRSVLPVRG